DPLEQQFQKLKTNIHQQLVESLDLSKIGRIDRQQLWRYVRNLADQTCGSRKDLLGRIDRERLLEELMAEIFGLGPLERLMQDPSVSDVLVNDPYTIYVERSG